MTLRFISCFAGIGGFDLAFERAGFECVAQVEIDPQCRKVLTKHWPNVPKVNDIREVRGDEFGPVDVVVGGWPCQDLSVAGRRAGLAGERSGLFHEFVRVARQSKARWILGENVPGALSSDEGRDMGIILGEVGKLGMGYAYRVLDAQHFGVAQRRRRVFVVGHLGAPWSAPCEVLFEPEGVRWNPPARGEARQDVAGTLGGGAQKRGWCDDLDRAGAFIGVIKGAAIGREPENGPQYGETLTDGSCFTLNCVERHAVAHALTAEGYDASEDGTGRGTPLVTAFDTTQITHPENRSKLDSNTCHSLAAGAHPPAIASTLVNPGRQYNSAQGEPNLVTAFHAEAGGDMRGVTGAVPGAVPGAVLSNQRTSIQQAATVRRLTPLECSRLMGFPDDWLGGIGLKDGAKYRMLGNSVVVPNIEWIARRMKDVDACP